MYHVTRSFVLFLILFIFLHVAGNFVLSNANTNNANKNGSQKKNNANNNNVNKSGDKKKTTKGKKGNANDNVNVNEFNFNFNDLLNEINNTTTNDNNNNNNNNDNNNNNNNDNDNSKNEINENNFNEELYNKLEKNFQLNTEDDENNKGDINMNQYDEKKYNLNDDNNKMKPNANDYQYNENDADTDNEEDLTNIWNKNMQNFEPSTLLTFEIPSNSEEYLFEEVPEVNTYFRGVFYSNNETDDNIIEFLISDPDGQVIYKKEASEGIFYFYTKKVGIYTLTLKNSKWMGKKLTTVALGLGENPSLRSDHVKDFTNYIQRIVAETKKLKNEIKYLSSKHMRHIEKMKKITNKAFLYCFIKLFVLIFLSLFTIYYIKRLVSNKRVL
ncbi:transmembrane emp24 domain-containing protein, putative [Plasmodium gaboni]|uniref:Transmembrane emp24 domain-containing protein, putative n=1 Tax=Plasmodium gaboni TaxID=647221 RepID=A0ABY1UIX6_9APIC|nr:transmembrane emp24 domain-containing protein, putative [Plasmodium gaboni]